MAMRWWTANVSVNYRMCVTLVGKVSISACRRPVSRQRSHLNISDRVTRRCAVSRRMRGVNGPELTFIEARLVGVVARGAFGVFSTRYLYTQCPY